jgi:hypothetical protein
MPHRRSIMSQLKREERYDLWKSAYRDKEKAETIALHDAPLINVHRAEVLRDSRGYYNPSLDWNRE